MSKEYCLLLEPELLDLAQKQQVGAVLTNFATTYNLG
jgi:hypothetical protein